MFAGTSERMFAQGADVAVDEKAADCALFVPKSPQLPQAPVERGRNRNARSGVSAWVRRARGMPMVELDMLRSYRPVPLEFERIDRDDALSRSEDFLALMERRRSVRHFSDEPVPRELIEN